MPTNLKFKRYTNREILLYNKADFSKIKKFFKTNLKIIDGSVEDKWNHFKNVYQQSINNFVPKRQIRSKTHHPWIGGHILDLMNKRKSAFDKWKSNDTLSNKNNYKRLVTETKNEIEKSQSNYFHNVLSNDIKDIRSNGRRFWKVKNKILTDNNSNIKSLYSDENCTKITDNDKEMANLLNK